MGQKTCVACGLQSLMVLCVGLWLLLAFGVGYVSARCGDSELHVWPVACTAMTWQFLALCACTSQAIMQALPDPQPCRSRPGTPDESCSVTRGLPAATCRRSKGHLVTKLHAFKVDSHSPTSNPHNSLSRPQTAVLLGAAGPPSPPLHR